MTNFAAISNVLSAATLASLSTAASEPVSLVAGRGNTEQGAAAGSRQFDELVITKGLDAASPKLYTGTGSADRLDDVDVDSNRAQSGDRGGYTQTIANQNPQNLDKSSPKFAENLPGGDVFLGSNSDGYFTHTLGGAAEESVDASTPKLSAQRNPLDEVTFTHSGVAVGNPGSSGFSDVSGLGTEIDGDPDQPLDIDDVRNDAGYIKIGGAIEAPRNDAAFIKLGDLTSTPEVNVDDQRNDAAYIKFDGITADAGRNDFEEIKVTYTAQGRADSGKAQGTPAVNTFA